MADNLPAMRADWDREMVDTLKQTVCRGATDAQFAMFKEVCKATGLNPFLREVWFVPSVGILTGRDGYLAVANRHPQFDGIETRVERDEKGLPIKAVCTVWRKDRGHPTICEAYYNEYRKPGNVWSQYPSAMIAKVSEVLALKRSFAINGVLSEEEMVAEPRGSIEAAQAVAQAKISGAMPLVSRQDAASATEAPPAPQNPTPAPETQPAAPADPLEAILVGFKSAAAITEAFRQIKAVWLKNESEEAFQQTLEQFGIAETANGFTGTVGKARKAFAAIWKACEKMQAEAGAQ